VLYIPSKSDEFIVAANNYNRFAVWSPNANVVLLFVNPLEKKGPQRKGNRSYGRPGRRPVAVAIMPEDIPGRRSELPHDGKPGPRMSPEIFSRWFIRTPKRNPRLDEWPDHAWYLNACLQLNVVRAGSSGLTNRLPFQLHGMGHGAQGFGSAAESAFGLHSWNKGQNRADLGCIVRDLISRGISRDKAVKISGDTWGIQFGFGPRIEDVTVMREHIAQMSKGGRILRQFEEGESPEINDLLKKLLAGEIKIELKLKHNIV